ncbi:MAG: phage protein GemA/Gp16 family protein [Bacteroidota bacterium]|nr:phage protein GemA/Gp16 family protein [Bacteroidota bacterium]
MTGIDKKQIMLIHVLKSKLGLSDDEYRAALGAYRVVTSVDLSRAQAEQLIRTLTDKAVAAGVWQRPVPRSKRDSLKYRVSSDGTPMATPEQVNMLEAMWTQVSREKRPDARREKFDRFINNRFHRGGLLMVEREMVHKIVRALVAMGAQTP